MNRINRMDLHTQAKVLMRASEWQKALALIYRARAAYGDNILLMIDQAACEYMDGSMFSWKKTFTEIESAVEMYREVLSANTLYNSHLFLGKFLEEQGQFKRALNLYSSIVEGAFDDRQKVMAQAQSLRVLCFLGLSRDAESSYVDLSTRVRAFKTENQRTEVLHSLMLGDLSVVGGEAALARFESAREGAFAKSDIELLYFDLLEGLLLNGIDQGLSTPDLSLLTGIPGAKAETSFEKALLEVLRGGCCLRYSEAFARSESLSLASQFRLAVLVHSFGATGADRSRALKLISVLLRSFDQSSARALTARFRLSGETLEHEEILIDHSTLRVHDHALNWTRRPTALALMRALVSGQTIGVEELVRSVWQTEFNPSYSDRLRVLVRRVNTDLQSVAMKPEIIVINGGNVSLASGVRVRVRA